ncbi:MAG TPA: sensor histidine kinase [Candidatus Limnocylindria bacterium]|nr:sensor histidine kinase [Candidatus Limnocylindria bacterium]
MRLAAAPASAWAALAAPLRRLRRLSLSSELLVLQVALVGGIVVVGGLLSYALVSSQIDEQYKQRALTIAYAVAATPDVLDAMDDRDPARTIQPIAEAIRRSVGADFVVVANEEGIRYSHPNPERIGERVSTDPSVALAGEVYVGMQEGTLGRSLRAKVPIVDGGGRVIGLVSVGFLEEQLAQKLAQALPIMTLTVLLALALGIGGSLVLARRVEQQTFGLDAREIAGLLEQRDAMLHGIREGVLALDAGGRVTLANDEARRLLALDAQSRGRSLEDIVPEGRVRDVLGGAEGGVDQIVLAGDRVLVVNRMPVAIRGREVGAVVTLRDRTELEGVLRELDTVRGLAQALRAQAHEFSNKLHTVGGLIELGRLDEALRFIAETSLVQQELVDLVQQRIADPALAALLLAKAAVASERHVEFRLADDARLPGEVPDVRDLITVVGNLVDNAIDAVAATPHGWVEVSVHVEPQGIGVRVRDSGGGIDVELAEEIFREGFTTKRAGSHHGIGLALVRQVTQRHGGWVRVTNDGGAVFTALVPVATR